MKYLLISSLLLSNAYAATIGTLLLQGNIPQRISLVVVPSSIATSLDLSTTQVDLQVATITEQSNSKSGYKVTVVSANSYNLKRVGGTEAFPYTLKYSLLTSVGAVNVNKSVTISYTGIPQESMVEGVYSDSVTFTISAN